MAVRARPQRDGSFDVTERLCRRLDVVNGSIVDGRHLVNVMLPIDWNDHDSSRSAATIPTVRVCVTFSRKQRLLQSAAPW